MSTMLYRIADAMSEAIDDSDAVALDYYQLLDMAAAALKVMREPSEEMDALMRKDSRPAPSPGG